MSRIKKPGICLMPIHGIRTPKTVMKSMKKHLRALANKRKMKFHIHSGEHGELSVKDFLFKDTTSVKVMTAENIKSLSKLFDRVYIIAHSHGTHLVIEALEMINEPIPNLYIAFLGGIVKCRYNFARLFDKFNILVNYCSVEDEVVSFAHIAGHGSSGRWGFRCQNGEKAQSRRKGLEVVWSKPLVINYHQNDQEHSQWFESEKYIENFFNLVNEEFG